MSDNSRESEQQEKERLLAYMSKRAVSRDFFLSSALKSYCKSERLSDAQLAQYLEIELAQLSLLGLCRRPDVADRVGFARDVKIIAEKYGITISKLANLLRRAAAYEANQVAETKESYNYLMAAQDREPESKEDENADD